jgi:hypothetical protein
MLFKFSRLTSMTVSGTTYFSFNASGLQTRCDGNPEGAKLQ